MIVKSPACWFVSVCLAMAIAFPACAYAAEPAWGDLTGRFVYDGPQPAPRILPITKDQKALGDTFVDESLVVHPTNQGIANVVLYLLPREDQLLPIHPSYDATADATVELLMEGGRFEPHVLLMRTSQTMRQINKDEIAYCANVATLSNPPSAVIVPTGKIELTTYPREERSPAPVTCNVHPWMKGFVLVRANPYMAKTDQDGRFEIKHLPAGEHTFRLWHESAGFLPDVTIESTATDDKGRLKLAIQAGRNELGEIALKPALFEPAKRPAPQPPR